MKLYKPTTAKLRRHLKAYETALAHCEKGAMAQHAALVEREIRALVQNGLRLATTLKAVKGYDHFENVAKDEHFGLHGSVNQSGD